ncbi:DNA polymerase I [Mycoplasmopsis felis]|uniref:5'-3' exonuclease n=1 Tax=Mycoplasmopsis felis TaxID=33923 RepID=UPI0021AFA8F5|nr:5'-3' exonuclease H3TH domain-containing protein [Mycoplasmopsis felis]UWV79227.1 DNA polymerase I [Mycoplasmopsis felis]
MNNKNLVIDGNYLLFQSFYASYRGDINTILRTSKGIPTNAIQLFLMQLLKLLKEIKPTHLFIAFDAYGQTLRHLQYQEYKSGRAKAPNELYIQMNLIKEILTKLNIKWLEQEAYEADDLIATFTNLLPGNNFVFSADKDLLQLVNSKTTLIHRKSDKYLYITNKNFYDLFEINPEQITSFKGLKGDPSDNLPGIKGVGDKTAIKLLNEFKDFDGIFRNIDSPIITKSLREKLKDGYEQGLLCFNLAKLNFNIPNFNTQIGDYELSINLDAGISLLEELELKIVIKWLAELSF